MAGVGINGRNQKLTLIPGLLMLYILLICWSSSCFVTTMFFKFKLWTRFMDTEVLTDCWDFSGCGCSNISEWEDHVTQYKPNSTFRKPFLTNMYIFVNEEIINERKEKAYIFCNVKYFILRISRKSLNIYFKRSTWWLYSLHCSTKNYKKRNVHREKKSGTSSSFHKSLKLILTFESNSVYM